jgi:hypothetical protein
MAAPCFALGFALAGFAAVLAGCCAEQTGSSNTARANRTGIALRDTRGL